jgi:hypothetical protein
MDINTVKNTILVGFEARFTQGFSSSAFNEALDIVGRVEVFGKDFAQEVAKTVVKFKKVSEKQAYIIARAYAENNGY